MCKVTNAAKRFDKAKAAREAAQTAVEEAQSIREKDKEAEAAAMKAHEEATQALERARQADKAGLEPATIDRRTAERGPIAQATLGAKYVAELTEYHGGE